MHSSQRTVALTVETGHTLLLTGPTKFRLVDGDAECYGAPIEYRRWITVEGFRQEPILALDSCMFEIKKEADGSWKELNESTVPAAWTEAADVVQRQHGVIVIVGDVDSGKSSLCTFLANICVRTGLKVGVVDGDVGQADIGPPTTVGSARLSNPVFSLQELQPDRAFFVGDTSPSSVPMKLTRSLIDLKQKLVGMVDVVLVNTDGWVGDPAAFHFKTELLHEIRPDLVLGIVRGEEIDSLLEILPPGSLRLPSSKYVRTRSREERKGAREAGYRRFLLGSTTLKVSLEHTTLRLFDQPQQSILRSDRRFTGFLAGLLGRDQELLDVARIRGVRENAVIVETKGVESPRFLEIGNIVLSPRYEEVGYGILH